MRVHIFFLLLPDQKSQHVHSVDSVAKHSRWNSSKVEFLSTRNNASIYVNNVDGCFGKQRFQCVFLFFTSPLRFPRPFILPRLIAPAMLSLRVLGGPIPKGEKVLIDVTPSTSFEAMFPLIHQRLGERGIMTDDIMGGLADQYDLVELEFVEGGKAKPSRTLSLHDSPKSSKLSAPAVLLRLKQSSRALVSSGSFGAFTSGGSFAVHSPSMVPTAVSPTNSASLPPILNTSQRRLSSDTVGSEHALIPSPSLIGSPSPMAAAIGNRRATIQHSLGAARSSREKLAILYGVPIGDFTKMVPLDRVLRRAQSTGRVEWLVAIAERALLGLSGDASAQPPAQNSAGSSSGSVGAPQRFILDDSTGSADFAVNDLAANDDASPAPKRSLLSLGGGSPSQLLRKMRSSGMLAQRAEDKRSVLSIGSLNILLQRVHRDCSSALSILFNVEHRLTYRVSAPPLPVDFKTFVFEAGATPRAAVATLMHKLVDLKYVRRDFEKFEQMERFRGEKAEFLRYEATIRSIVQKVFYAHWCLMQQGFLALYEQDYRVHRIVGTEHRERQLIVSKAFESFELAIRKDYVEAAEERHRWQYISYHIQTREHFSRRVVVVQYWVAQRMLELERDFAMAAQVMQRIFRRALVGYRELELHKMVDLETTYRTLLWQREWSLRIALFETQEQLYRHWLDNAVLTWLAPIVEKIAAKAIADGRVLLALEMKEMRNVRAREEARLRVLLRQNSSVHF